MPNAFNAICKWRSPSKIKTVKMLIKSLPGREMREEDAEVAMLKRWDEYGTRADFFRTPYQLACQLGLYYIKNGVYIPRFSKVPTNIKIEKYLNHWIDHYYAPNPYTETSDHPSLEPKLVVLELFKLCQNKGEIKWTEAETAIFGEITSTSARLRNIIDTHSKLIEIKNEIVSIRKGADKSLVKQLTEIEFQNSANDKKAFFEWFYGYESINDFIEIHNIDTDLNSDKKTEKLQLAKSRVGQGVFRESLFNEFQFCPITLCDDARLLIAGHIKPWNKSSNFERLDPKNGFLFTPTIDKLFDKGLISFNSDKSILLSSDLDQKNIEHLNLNNGDIIDNLPIEGREKYLRYHREKVFIK